MSLIPTLQTIQTGDADDPSRDMSNWNAIRNVVNGNLDTTNLSSTAGIVITQLSTGTAWATWTPTLVGWSGSPSVTARYINIFKVVTVIISIAGTSNSTSASFTLPTTSVNLIDEPCRVEDNTVLTTTYGLIECSASSATANCYKLPDGTGWTASGTKIVRATFQYESAT